MFYLLKNSMRHFLLSFFLLFLFFSINICHAQILSGDVTEEINKKVLDLKSEAGVGTETPSIAKSAQVIINGFLGLLAVIFIILVILAGYNWMTASGDDQKVTKAKETIQKAVIGIIIIACSYAITQFVFKNLPMGGGAAQGGQQ